MRTSRVPVSVARCSASLADASRLSCTKSKNALYPFQFVCALVNKRRIVGQIGKPGMETENDDLVRNMVSALDHSRSHTSDGGFGIRL